MAKILVFLVVSCWLSACSEYTKPAFHYEASFDPAMVDNVERFMHDISDDWGLRLWEQDREASKWATYGQEALVIGLGHNIRDSDRPILIMSNVGFGVILSLQLYDRGRMPLSELERLGEDIRNGLNNEFGIELVPVER